MHFVYTAQDARVLRDGCRQRQEAALVGVETEHAAKAFYPQLVAIEQVGACGEEAVGQVHLLQETHAVDGIARQTVSVGMPETVVAVYGNAAREHLERVESVFPYDKALALLVVFLYGKDAEGEHPAVSRACQLHYVAVLAFRGYALKSVGRRVLAHAIDGGDPQPSLGIASYVLNVVVGQARGIVGTEILVILVAVKLVETPERGYPDLPIAVFGKSLDVLIGDVVG